MKVRRDDVIGRSFADVWPNSENIWQDVILDCASSGRISRCEGRSRDADGYLKAIAFPLPESHAAVIFLDKTELKRSDAALRRKEEDLRTLAAQLTLIEENTRRAIASDIHDRVGCELVSQLNTLKRISAMSLPQEAAGEIRKLAENTEKLISESRSLIFELSPPVLKEVGLNPALEALARNMFDRRGIRWTFRAKGTREEFFADDEICVILYRMTRELLVNVIKHSGASNVNIIVNRGAQRIMVAVEDDGRGFTERGSGGFGLFSIRERLRAVGGEISIISSPGEGATVAMSCPRLLNLKRSSPRG